MFRAPACRCLVAALVGLALGWRSVAQAQPEARASAPSATRGRVDDAREHFVLGMQLFDAGSFREALHEFELVTRLAPNADVWFNIGRAHEELGEYRRARRAFERYLRDSVQAKDADGVRRRIAELEQLSASTAPAASTATMLGSLRIHVPGGIPEALVLLDGRRLEAARLERPVLLSVGRHRLDVSHDDYVPIHARVDIYPGLLTAAYADLRPRTRTRMQAPSHGLTWALLGVAGLGALGGIVFGGVAIQQQAHGDVQRAEDWALISDVSFVGTAVCALAATVVYYLESRTARTERVRAVAAAD